jgi:Ca2+/Na+ antiporter
VVAVGSSFPEFSSVVISTVFHGEFSLGVGAIVGSAIFNLLVIPAFSALASEQLESTRDIVHKDAQFYVISVLVLFIVFIRTHLELTDREAYGFLLLLYALFLLWMVLESVGLVETVRGI